MAPVTYPLLACDPCGRKPIRHRDDGLVRVNDYTNATIMVGLGLKEAG